MGTRTGAITITDDASGSPQTVGLTGTGIAPVASVSPTTVNFGNQLLNTTSAAQAVTLSNTGTSPLNISSIVAGGGLPPAEARRAGGGGGGGVGEAGCGGRGWSAR